LQFEEDYEMWTTVVVACIVVVVVLMMLLLLVLLLLLLLFGRRFKVEHDTRVHTPSMSPITHGHKAKVFSAIDFLQK
jgi:type IV secretory pathway VirB3-like protein